MNDTTPQPSTHHPPPRRPDLPWQKHVLIRLNEIIGLLDGIDAFLARLSVCVSQASVVDDPDIDAASHSPEAELLSLLMQKVEEP